MGKFRLKRAKSICKSPGCTELLPAPGYCAKHQHKAKPDRYHFDRLDQKKEDWKRKFYATYAWQQKSIQYRLSHPFCERCYEAGWRDVVSQLVHHDPPLEELIRLGLDPFDDRYLEAICNNCHLEELRKKKQTRN